MTNNPVNSLLELWFYQPLTVDWRHRDAPQSARPREIITEYDLSWLPIDAGGATTIFERQGGLFHLQNVKMRLKIPRLRGVKSVRLGP